MSSNSSKDNTTLSNALGEFRGGPRLDFFARTMKQGLPYPLKTPPHFSSVFTPKRPFDDTLLNANDSLIRKKRRRSFNSSNISDADSHNASIGTPWELKHLRAELAQAKSEIKSLELNISQLHGVRKEAEILFEYEKTSLKNSLERERTTVAELERRVKILKRREDKLRENLAEAYSNVNDERHDYESQAANLYEENMNLKQQMIDIEEEKKSLELETKKIKMESEKFESELKLANEQLDLLNEKMTELRANLRDVEDNKLSLSKAESKIRELECELKTTNETNAIVKLQQSKLLKYGEMERQLRHLAYQNNKLRDSSVNSIMLESVVEELKVKLGSMGEREKELSKARVELGFLEGRLAEFTRLGEEIIGPGATPDSIMSYLRNIQTDNLLTKDQIGQLKTKIQMMEENAKATALELMRQKEEIVQINKELETSNSKVKRLKKQHALILWERNDLRNLLDSCQKEVTITALNSDPRIEALEKLVDGYRKKINEIESDPAFTTMSGPYVSKISSSEMDKLIAENKALKEEVDKYKNEIDHRALKGDFNTQNTRILHFKMNPVAEAIEQRGSELEKYKAENIQLKERVRLLQDGQAIDLTQTIANVVNADTAKDLEDLRNKVKSQEKQNERLKEAFKAKGHEFREAILSLLGYKVDGLPNKVYRLSSLYSESPDDHLIFKMSPTGGLELLETEFSQSLTELLELVLVPHNSIPVFLASLTIDLFKRNTHVELDVTVQQRP